MRYKSHIKTLSEKIHLKLINILKSKILSDLGHTKEIHNFIFSLVDAYSRRSKENLILQELSLLLKESIKKSNRSLIQEIKGKIYSNMK
jgi:hypothetical protein